MVGKIKEMLVERARAPHALYSYTAPSRDVVGLLTDAFRAAGIQQPELPRMMQIAGSSELGKLDSQLRSAGRLAQAAILTDWVSHACYVPYRLAAEMYASTLGVSSRTFERIASIARGMGVTSRRMYVASISAAHAIQRRHVRAMPLSRLHAYMPEVVMMLAESCSLYISNIFSSGRDRLGGFGRALEERLDRECYGQWKGWEDTFYTFFITLVRDEAYLPLYYLSTNGAAYHAYAALLVGGYRGKSMKPERAWEIVEEWLSREAVRRPGSNTRKTMFTRGVAALLGLGRLRYTQDGELLVVDDDIAERSEQIFHLYASRCQSRNVPAILELARKIFFKTCLAPAESFAAALVYTGLLHPCPADAPRAAVRAICRHLGEIGRVIATRVEARLRNRNLHLLEQHVLLTRSNSEAHEIWRQAMRIATHHISKTTPKELPETVIQRIHEDYTRHQPSDA
ncbi:MAG: hypothetical protein NXY59_02245 [Aigarchaeota archaeon]|nr:hypothetical protein [Candidatus Pelearchaeum maunauluense]